jgi:hypothetical protein
VCLGCFYDGDEDKCYEKGTRCEDFKVEGSCLSVFNEINEIEVGLVFFF